MTSYAREMAQYEISKSKYATARFVSKIEYSTVSADIVFSDPIGFRDVIARKCVLSFLVQDTKKIVWADPALANANEMPWFSEVPISREKKNKKKNKKKKKKENKKVRL